MDSLTVVGTRKVKAGSLGRNQGVSRPHSLQRLWRTHSSLLPLAGAGSLPWHEATLLPSLPLWFHSLLLCLQLPSPTSLAEGPSRRHLGSTQNTQAYLISKPLITYKLASKLTFMGSRDQGMISLGATYQPVAICSIFPAVPFRGALTAGQRVYVILALVDAIKRLPKPVVETDTPINSSFRSSKFSPTPASPC